jgi:hypothetical protein
LCKQQRIIEDLAKGVVEFDSDLTAVNVIKGLLGEQTQEAIA